MTSRPLRNVSSVCAKAQHICIHRKCPANARVSKKSIVVWRSLSLAIVVWRSPSLAIVVWRSLIFQTSHSACSSAVVKITSFLHQLYSGGLIFAPMVWRLSKVWIPAPQKPIRGILWKQYSACYLHQFPYGGAHRLPQAWLIHDPISLPHFFIGSASLTSLQHCNDPSHIRLDFLLILALALFQMPQRYPRHFLR